MARGRTGGGEKGRFEGREHALSSQVIAAAIAVHRHLGPGHLENVYQAAMSLELAHLGIPYAREVPVALRYRDAVVGEGRLDFLIDDQLVVELKAVEHLMPVHSAQVISYLAITGHEVGLLINFHVFKLTDGIRRLQRPQGKADMPLDARPPSPTLTP